MLYRHLTKQIVSDLDFFPAVGIVGSRQVGKTTLAKTITYSKNINSVYLDLELDY